MTAHPSVGFQPVFCLRDHINPDRGEDLVFVRGQNDSFANTTSTTDALYEDAILVESGEFLVQLTGVMDDLVPI